MKDLLVRSCYSLVAAAALCASAAAQCSSAKLISGDPNSDDLFGGSVDLSGDYALIGSRGDKTGTGTDAGAAYFFHRSGAVWTQTQKITSPDWAIGENFGASVAIDGDYAIIGCPNDSYSSINSLGSVYIYHLSGGTWSLQSNLLMPNNGHRANNVRFGSAVSISGASVAIAAGYEDNSAGAVYIFTRSGTAWTLQQRIQPAGLGYPDFFGNSVSLDANTLAVGCTGDDTVNGFATGSAYVFVRSGTTWTQQAKLVGSLSTSSAQVGRAIAVSGNRLAVSTIETTSGIVYTFSRSGTTWTQEDRLTAPIVNQSSYFGESIDMSGAGTEMVIGRDAAGAAVGGRVGQYARVGNHWTLSRDLVASDSSNAFNFGVSCAVDGNTVLVGDEANDFSGLANPGAAYIFDSAVADTCASALPVVAGTYFGSTACAAANGATTCGSSDGSRDVYYSYTAPCTQRVTFDTHGSAYDTVLSVHSACPATAANTLGCNDDIQPGIDTTSGVALDLAAGQTVVIRVSGFFGSSGAFELNISESALLNNNCFSAALVGDGQYPFGNCLASTDGQAFAGPCTITQIYNDLWYNYFAACNAQVTASTCTSTIFDTAIAAYETTTCELANSAHLIACNDDYCGLQSRISFAAQSGHTYLIRVGGFAPGDLGSGVLTIDSVANCPADFNDDGGIDGSDVSSFFAAWESGQASADVNCDGGIDGADVTVFFSAWENGGC